MTTTQSDKNNKWIWIGLGAAALFCLCAVGVATLLVMRLGQQVQEGMKTDPEATAATAHTIADYELPEGYQEQFSMDVMVYTMVFIVSDSTSSPSARPMIMLAQFGAMGNQQQMERQIRQSFEQQAGRRGLKMTLVGVQKMNIRGEDVEVFTYEGTDEQGFTMRQVVATFPGKNGTAMLIIMGSASSWDEDEIDTFIQSIN